MKKNGFTPLEIMTISYQADSGSDRSTSFIARFTKNRRSSRGGLSLTGFTLLEIMVSTVILSLLAAGTFSVLVSSRSLVARSKKRVAAVEIARAEIERMKSLEDAATWSPSGLLDGTGTWRAWDTASYPPYRVRYRVDNVANTEDYRKVTVQVAWNDTAI